MNTDRRWFPGSPAVVDPLPLFCLPHGGGGASAYRSWRGRLAPVAEVVPVQPPGREGRAAEPAEWSMSDLAAQFVGALGRRVEDRPYAIFGHSMGALLGYEATVAMTAAGRPPELLVVSGAPAPQLPLDRERPVHAMPEDELVGHLRDLAGTPDSVLRNSDLLGMLVPTVRADFAACETYVHPAHPVIDVPLLVLGGEQDAGVPVETLLPWAERTSGAFAAHTFPGGHFFHLDTTDHVLSLIARALSGQLQGATG